MIMLQRPFLTLTLLALVLLPACRACILSLDTMAELERTVADFSVPREYILCPNNEYLVGTLDFLNEIQNGTDMIHARPNLIVKCGDDGVRENSCVVKGGSIHVEGTGFYGVNPNKTIDSVIISGLTFEGATKHSVWLTKPGNIMFQDCEFRNNVEALSTVMADYSSPDGSDELVVTFENTAFDGNTYSASPAQPAVVVGNGINNRLNFENCEFTNNDMVKNNSMSSAASFLIETSGPLTVRSSCFTDNKVGVAPIMSYNPTYTLTSNFQSNSEGSVCPLSGHITTASELNAPSCTSADATSCQSQNTRMPTTSPTTSPSPTKAPMQGEGDGGNGNGGDGGDDNQPPTPTAEPMGENSTTNLEENSGSVVPSAVAWKVFAAVAAILAMMV